MTRRVPAHCTILSVSPSTIGFGFAVMELRGRLVSWGVARLYSKNEEEFLVRLAGTMEKYCVRLLCVEVLYGTRHGKRARRMVTSAIALAKSRRLAVSEISRDQVRTLLGLDERASKHDVATRLAEAFPELTPLVPPKRKPWQSEAERMKVFQALGLAIVAIGSKDSGHSTLPSRQL